MYDTHWVRRVVAPLPALSGRGSFFKGCRNPPSIIAGDSEKTSFPKSKERPATYYNWKSKYGGLSVSELKRIKELEAEHSKLKRMYADLAMENEALKELVEKKF